MKHPLSQARALFILAASSTLSEWGSSFGFERNGGTSDVFGCDAGSVVWGDVTPSP